MMRRLIEALLQTEASDGNWLKKMVEVVPQESEITSTGVYDALKKSANIANYKPTARPDVIAELARGAQSEAYILKDPKTQLYIQVSPEEHYLWTQMDGTRSVLDLVVGYCMKYKTLAQARIIGLVESLMRFDLLTDKPFDVYEMISNRLARRTPRYYTDKVMTIFLMHQLPIRGIDGALGWLYRHVFKIFYHPLSLILMLSVAIGGGIIYALLALSGTYSVFGDSESFAEGAATLGILQILSIVLHEGGHAFTVKHFGREVRRAGLLFYLGILGAFVDTTDILFEGKWKRIAVTAAGPFLNLVLGGATAIVIAARPTDPLAPLLFQFAVTQYFLVVINATPFIKFDGYYILSDLMGIDNLQEKALAFLKNGLYYSFSSAWKRGRLFPALTREEKLLGIFGGISTIWVANLFFLAILLAPVRFVNIIREIFSGGDLQQLFVPLVFLFSLLLGFVPRVVRAFRNNLDRLNTIASKQPAWRGFGALVGVAVILVAVPIYAQTDSASIASLYARLIPTATGLVATLLTFRQVKRFEGARWGLMSIGLLLTSGLITLINIIELLPGDILLIFEMAKWHALSVIPAIAGVISVWQLWLMSLQSGQKWAWLLIALGVLFLIVTAFLPPIFNRPHVTTQLGQYLWAFGVFLYTRLTQRGLPEVQTVLPPQNVLVGTPPQQGRFALRWLAERVVKQVAAAVGQQKLLPLATEFNRNSASKMWRVWMTMEGEVNTRPRPQAEWEEIRTKWQQALDDLMTKTAAMTGTSLVQSALYEAFADLARPLQPMGLELLAGTKWTEGLESLISADGDRIYLRRAFQSIGEHLVGTCSEVYGWRIGEMVIANFNRLSASHGWGVWLRAQGKFDTHQTTDPDILTAQRLYRHALTGLIACLTPSMGLTAIQTALTRARDALPWTQRELADTLLLDGLRVAGVMSEEERITALQSIPDLSGLSSTSLQNISRHLLPAHVNAGQTLIKQGQIPQQAYVIVDGRVQTMQEDADGIVHILNAIDSGGLGWEETIHKTPLKVSYKAITDVHLLVVNEAHVHPYLSDAENRQSASHASHTMLRQIALFREMPLTQLESVSQSLEPHMVESGTILIEQGKPVGALYIIQAGQFEVTITTNDKQQVIATLGPGEVCGEQSLLTGSVASATVCARTTATALRLDGDNFRELMQANQTVMSRLEQVSSRRRLTTREPLTLAQTT